MLDASVAASLQYANQNRLSDSWANLSGGAAMPSSRRAMSADQAEAVARDFESLFIAQMVEQMFGDSIGDELFGDRETSEVYKSLMVEQYGKQIAGAGGIGIADFVKRELLKLQEV